MCCGPTPVTRVRSSQGRRIRHGGGNQHGFVPRKHCLAKGHDTAGIVLDANVGGGGLAIGLVGKRFLNVAILVAIQATILFESAGRP